MIGAYGIQGFVGQSVCYPVVPAVKKGWCTFPMVELKNVSVTYASGVDALNNVSLKINDGDFAFVVGSSGAGKSTMIKLILKEIDATSGVVTVNGYNLSKLKRRKIPELRRTIGFVFQDFRLIPSMTVYENIAFVLRVIDAPRK